MLRDAKSLDVIETLLLTLADCEQRVAWIDGENAVTVEPPQHDRPAATTLLKPRLYRRLPEPKHVRFTFNFNYAPTSPR